MSKRLKDIAFLAIFVLILFLFTLTSLFSKKVLWPEPASDREFAGIIFSDPATVEKLFIERSLVKNGDDSLVEYKVNFESQDGVEARILGTPVRHVFFDGEGKKSLATLKGDYDKINNMLFEENLKLRDLYKKSDNFAFVPKSYMKVKFDKKVQKHSFTLYYEPSVLNYMDKKVEECSVFLTNAKVNSWKENSSKKDIAQASFTKNGFSAEQFEKIDDALVKKITITNTLSAIIFLGTVAISVALIWLNKGRFSIYLIMLLLMIPSFYRFLDLGVKTPGLLIVFPILAYIGAICARLMSSEIRLQKNDFKKSLAFAILYFIAVIIVFIIPRAI